MNENGVSFRKVDVFSENGWIRRERSRLLWGLDGISKFRPKPVPDDSSTISSHISELEISWLRYFAAANVNFLTQMWSRDLGCKTDNQKLTSDHQGDANIPKAPFVKLSRALVVHRSLIRLPIWALCLQMGLRAKAPRGRGDVQSCPKAETQLSLGGE